MLRRCPCSRWICPFFVRGALLRFLVLLLALSVASVVWCERKNAVEEVLGDVDRTLFALSSNVLGICMTDKPADSYVIYKAPHHFRRNPVNFRRNPIHFLHDRRKEIVSHMHESSDRTLPRLMDLFLFRLCLLLLVVIVIVVMVAMIAVIVIVDVAGNSSPALALGLFASAPPPHHHPERSRAWCANPWHSPLYPLKASLKQANITGSASDWHFPESNPQVAIRLQNKPTEPTDSKIHADGAHRYLYPTLP